MRWAYGLGRDRVADEEEGEGKYESVAPSHQVQASILHN